MTLIAGISAGIRIAQALGLSDAEGWQARLDELKDGAETAMKALLLLYGEVAEATWIGTRRKLMELAAHENPAIVKENVH